MPRLLKPVWNLCTARKNSPTLVQLEKDCIQQQRPSETKNKLKVFLKSHFGVTSHQATVWTGIKNKVKLGKNKSSCVSLPWDVEQTTSSLLENRIKSNIWVEGPLSTVSERAVGAIPSNQPGNVLIIYCWCFICLLLAVLGHLCCKWAFSTCSRQGLLSGCGVRVFIEVEHWL